MDSSGAVQDTQYEMSSSSVTRCGFMIIRVPLIKMEVNQIRPNLHPHRVPDPISSISRDSDNTITLLLAVEYNAPHKLSAETFVGGFEQSYFIEALSNEIAVPLKTQRN